MENKKSGFIAIVGRPNVGKSTLMNNLIGQKIAITSKKPQTTRNKILTVYTDERGQAIFLDTPGIHRPKNKLGDYMLKVVNKSIHDVDLILYLVEANDYIGELDEYILSLLKEVKKQVILAINKVDILKNKDDILKIIDMYSKEINFAEVLPISALKSKNTDKLLDIIFSYLEEGPYYYDEDVVTDQPVKAIVAELIREKLLNCLDKEVPHGIAIEIDKMQYSKNIVNIEATIVAERDSHKAIILGKAGSMIKKIGIISRKDIEDLVEKQVNLKLFVKIRKEWRDNQVQIKNFGYNINNI